MRKPCGNVLARCHTSRKMDTPMSATDRPLLASKHQRRPRRRQECQQRLAPQPVQLECKLHFRIPIPIDLLPTNAEQLGKCTYPGISQKALEKQCGNKMAELPHQGVS